MSAPPLSYLSEQDRDWAKALRATTTLKSLRQLCKDWGEWTRDAKAVADHMNPDDFEAFRTGLLAKTSDEEWAARFGAIAIPGRLLEISLIAEQFGAPFGTAAIRYGEHGGLKAAWLKRVP